MCLYICVCVCVCLYVCVCSLEACWGGGVRGWIQGAVPALHTEKRENWVFVFCVWLYHWAWAWTLLFVWWTDQRPHRTTTLIQHLIRSWNSTLRVCVCVCVCVCAHMSVFLIWSLLRIHTWTCWMFGNLSVSFLANVQPPCSKLLTSKGQENRGSLK